MVRRVGLDCLRSRKAIAPRYTMRSVSPEVKKVSRSLRVIVFGWLCLASSACERSESLPPAPLDSMVLREHRPLQAAKPTKELGESCTQAGASECQSGLCLHAAPGGRAQGYFCSQACADGAGCPAGWGCAQLFPGQPGNVCVPPPTWVGAAARGVSDK